MGKKSQIISKNNHIYNDPTPRNRTFKIPRSQIQSLSRPQVEETQEAKANTDWV